MRVSRALRKAQDNAPFGREICKAIETLCTSVRHVQITLTGGPAYGIARPHSTHNNPPPKEVKLRMWDTIPLWKEQAAKK